ncbi:MAG: site-specific DNA-methyltransferase [Planctomycetia bacterium]|nr:site-specific DNA-methyltransferase [Planctomycetia bacterium]
MDWPGKKDALRLIQTPSAATLKLCREESVNFDTTENLFIEGDNLEVLKLLQKSYYGKVKMIYIDPPYNTGKEFIYPDNFSESLQTYLEYAGLMDGDGKKFSTNTANEGRFHTKWLNMMYPRLYWARNLLRDDGVIFISVDDNEVSNLRKVCDEIFGEENFVANVVWQKKYADTNDAQGISVMHDHIIVYQKSDSFIRVLLPRTDEQNKPYKNDDGDGKGLWRSDNLLVKSFSSAGVYPISNPKTGKEYFPPEGSCWRASKETMKVWLSENRVFFGKDGTGAPQLKRYLNEVQDGRVPTTWWSFEDVGHNDAANKELKSLFESKAPFDTPKPSTLINRMLQISTTVPADVPSKSSADSDIILDFFSGSATTAHAVLELNKQDGGNRKFILVQLPEPCAEDSEAFKAGYKTIADIGKERIHRVIKKLNAEEAGQLALKNHVKQDRGFKVLKLNKSNFKQWQNLAPDAKPELIQKQLFEHIDYIDHKATPEDLLYEILIKAGFKPTEKVEVLELKDGKLSRRDAERKRNRKRPSRKGIFIFFS